MRWIIFGGTVLLLATGAQAQLYSCVENGRTRYVSAPEQCGGKARNLSPQKKKAKPKKSGKSSGASSRAPGKFPKISAQKQKTMDKVRSKVLLYELESEEKNKAVVEGMLDKTPPEEIQRLDILQKKRKEHALNITAIQQELARLGIYASHSGN